MPSSRTNNFPESGRGLGHVVPIIFGTVGNPSDSLASCTNLATGQADMIIPVMRTVNISLLKKLLSWRRL